MRLIWIQLALGLFQTDLAVKHEIDKEPAPEYARELEWSCCGNKFEDLQAVYKSSLDRSSKRHYNDNVKAINMALT